MSSVAGATRPQRVAKYRELRAQGTAKELAHHYAFKLWHGTPTGEDAARSIADLQRPDVVVIEENATAIRITRMTTTLAAPPAPVFSAGPLAPVFAAGRRSARPRERRPQAARRQSGASRDGPSRQEDDDPHDVGGRGAAAVVRLGAHIARRQARRLSHSRRTAVA